MSRVMEVGGEAKISGAIRAVACEMGRSTLFRVEESVAFPFGDLGSELDQGDRP